MIEIPYDYNLAKRLAVQLQMFRNRSDKEPLRADEMLVRVDRETFIRLAECFIESHSKPS